MLEVDGLSKSYDGVAALNDVSFAVQPGRVTGFLGPNGAGKTTTMRAIFGLIAPDGGAIRWMGSPVTAGDRLRFGYMPEERGLYNSMEVALQLVYYARLHGMPRQKAEKAVVRWLDRLGLTDRSKSKVEELSHGNQQRVQLAAALVHNPDLIVLDEPFSGLDPLAVRSMSAVLEELAASGAAVVLSSHQLDLVEDVCEEVVIINRGEIAVTGTIRDLREAQPYRVLEIGGAGDWVPEERQAKLLQRRNGWARYLIPKEADVEHLLVQAQKNGEVNRFSYGAPALSEIFAEAVGVPMVERGQ